MKNTLVIDGNNLMYRALKVHTHLSYEGKNTSMIFGVPNIIRSLITLLSARDVYVVFDGGRSKIRKEIHPGYKDRDKGDDFDFKDFKRQKKIVIKILKNLGIPVLIVEGYEADDIMWLITRKLKRRNPVIIVSTDKDFNQCLSPKVSIWNAFRNKRITYKNLFKEYGYYPEETVDWLVMMGDKSDCIEGVKGMGKVTTRKFLDKHSIKEYLIDGHEQFKRFEKKDIEKVYLFNRQLIDLRLFLRRNKVSMKSLGISLEPTKKFKVKNLRNIISKYDLRSFEKESFIRAFKSLNYGS